MAKRFVDTEIWDKEWFMELSLKHKCLIRFMFDKCDVAGIWNPNWSLASTYIGERVNLADIEPFKDHIKILPDGKFYLVDFIEFQYGTLSESCNPHQKIIAILKKHNLFQGYLKGTSRVLEKEKDKEKDKEKEKDKDKRVTKFEIVFPFDSVEFLETWGRWVAYRKEIKKPYKSDMSIQAALQELSKHGEKTAIAMLKQSIANGWQGIFEIKEQHGKQANSNSKNTNSINVANDALDRFRQLRGINNDGGHQG